MVGFFYYLPLYLPVLRMTNQRYQAPAKDPIINCHTHIFTADHVPPWLGRTFLPLGTYFLLTTGFIVGLGKFWFMGKFMRRLRRLRRSRVSQWMYTISWAIRRTWISDFLVSTVGYWLTAHTFFYVYRVVSSVIKPNTGEKQVDDVYQWFRQSPFFMDITNPWGKVGIALIVLLFFSSGRNLILFTFKKLFRFLAMLPGPATREFLLRYINLGRFAIYSEQSRIYSRLRKQYPPGSAFVILPMDMEFMGAGKLKEEHRFKTQMQELSTIKKNHPETTFPFVFIHPERMKDTSFFDYDLIDGKVELKKACDVYRYIEKENFTGFKIYPALGYYPFDEQLLPLWRYAADHEIPIMSHCIIGTIFYRGPKLRDWNQHPVFEEVRSLAAEEEEDFGILEQPEEKKHRKPAAPTAYERFPLKMHELENKEFQRNFTHPLNYLCLLDDDHLIKVLKKATNPKTREVFGLKNGKLEYNLQRLKICLAHFGGDDEWKQYYELDRHHFVHQLTMKPDWGIDFFETDGEPRPGKIGQLWKNKVDWYSIICSLILQYPNVYADISYIVHNPEIIPLLKKTLAKENIRLRSRVLFGTDFYVVRNHKSEREMLTELQAALSEEDFDQIARTNPRDYLSRKTFHP